MISIIICSVKPDLLAKFTENVAATIGVAYEIIPINNQINPKGICEVYNEGLAQAKFDTICFCHEDIAIETMNWGTGIINLFAAHPDIGLLGVAGAVYKSKYPTGWPTVPTEYYRTNIVQQLKDGRLYYSSKLDNGNYSEVAVIDGCFIAGKKKVFDLFKWNDHLLKGFHLYDVDISLRVGQIYKIAVSNAVKIIHFSEGNMNNSWLQQSELFHAANTIQLPKATIKLSKHEVVALEYFSLYAYILLLISLQQSKSKIATLYFKLCFLSPLNRKNLSMLKRVISFGFN